MPISSWAKPLKLVAEKYNISREDMEEMAVRSHKLAAQAQAAGKFDEEIIPVTTTFQGKEITVTKDEGIRREPVWKVWLL